MRVKVCGITGYRDAALALDCGVDGLGFNFFARSPRFIKPSEARSIIRRLPPFAVSVGVFVNVEDPNGEIRVEILSQAGAVVPRFTVKDCAPVTADKTLHLVRWTGVEDLSSLANQPVRFRFHLKNGRLFAFWVSPEKKGASHGYVAAGGPGFSSNRDLGGSAGQIQ